MGLVKYAIRTRLGEPPLIEVNGEPIPDAMVVLGLTLAADADRVPRLTLAVAGEVAIEGEGIVQVERQVEGVEVQVLLDLIQGIDGAELDRRSLAFGGAVPPGEAFKAAIVELIMEAVRGPDLG